MILQLRCWQKEWWSNLKLGVAKELIFILAGETLWQDSLLLSFALVFSIFCHFFQSFFTLSLALYFILLSFLLNNPWRFLNIRLIWMRLSQIYSHASEELVYTHLWPRQIHFVDSMCFTFSCLFCSVLLIRKSPVFPFPLVSHVLPDANNMLGSGGKHLISCSV